MRVLLFLRPVVAGAAAIFALSYYLASNGSSADQTATSPAPSSPEARGSFLGRDVLAACIQADEPVDTQVFVDTVERIKARLSLHPGENIERFNGAYAVQACPPHNLTGERVERGAMGKLVETPSEFTLFIYVIDPELFQQAFGDAPHGETTAEHECSGDACWGVTGGLYVTSTYFRKSA